MDHPVAPMRRTLVINKWGSSKWTGYNEGMQTEECVPMPSHTHVQWNTRILADSRCVLLTLRHRRTARVRGQMNARLFSLVCASYSSRQTAGFLFNRTGTCLSVPLLITFLFSVVHHLCVVAPSLSSSSRTYHHTNGA